MEGDTRLLVPRDSLGSRGPPPKFPVFFNPLAGPTRDLAILFYSAYSSASGVRLRVLDALAGLGAKGIRIAKESRSASLVHINDINPSAIELARKNCELNGVGDICEFTSDDANALMYSSPRSTSTSTSTSGLRFDAIDVDPFGSPAPFIDAAVSTVRRGGVVAVTATDLSALGGRSRASGRRKYFLEAWPTDFPREVIARALAAYTSIRAASRERGAVPVFAHVTSQYARVYLKVTGGARSADDALDRIGYLEYCPRCLYRGVHEPGGSRRCPICSGELRIIGPVWLGELSDEPLLRSMIAVSDERGWSRHSVIIGRALAEIGLPPYYYSLDRISDAMNICVPRLADLIKLLESGGYRATRSSMHDSGIKTDAPPQAVIEGLRSLHGC